MTGTGFSTGKKIDSGTMLIANHLGGKTMLIIKDGKAEASPSEHVIEDARAAYNREKANPTVSEGHVSFLESWIDLFANPQTPQVSGLASGKGSIATAVTSFTGVPLKGSRAQAVTIESHDNPMKKRLEEFKASAPQASSPHKGSTAHAVTK